MKVRYFEDTDTMLIEFRDAPVTQTRDLDENTVLDLDAKAVMRHLFGAAGPSRDRGPAAPVTTGGISSGRAVATVSSSTLRGLGT
jgi:hypothetical protein